MSKHTIVDVKRMAGHLLSDPKRHVAYEVAMTVDGDAIGLSHPRNCRWCYVGALRECNRVLRGVPDYLENLDEDTVENVDRWNEGSTETRLEMARKLREAT